MAVTWNPLDKWWINLSNGDLTATTHYINSHRGVRATESKDSGKWYWEIYTGLVSEDSEIGFATSAAAIGEELGRDSYGYGYRGSGIKNHSNYQQAYGATYTTGAIIGIALDLDNGKVWWSKNGVWQASGDPAAGTNEAYSGISGAFFPAWSGYWADQIVTARFTSASQTYSPPSGFYSYDSVIYYFSGNVFEQQVPVSRTLYLYDRPTGALVATTTSASGTGYYYMETVSSGSHNIVCLDDDPGTNCNDLISGNVFPTTTL